MKKVLNIIISLIVIVSFSAYFLFPKVSYAAIAVDASSSNEATTGGTTLSWSHTTSGSNRLLVVGVQYESDTEGVSSITYNGVGLTYIRGSSQTLATPDINVELWYLVAPDTGTNTVTVTWGGSVNGRSAGAVSLTGAAQTGQPDNHAGSTEFNSDSVSMDITTIADNTIIVDSVITSDGGEVITAGAGQTERYQENYTGSAATSGAGSTEAKATAGTVAMSWSNGIAAPEWWAISAASFAPFTGATPEGDGHKYVIGSQVKVIFDGRNKFIFQ